MCIRDRSNAAVTDGGNATADTDVGYVRMTSSGNDITIETCFTTSCGTAANRSSNKVKVE